MDLTNLTDLNVRNFIDESGMPIANRGMASQASLDHIDRLMEEAASTTGKALVRKLEDLNRLYLKIFLQNSDVFIARASFMSYYKQSLKKQKLEYKNIDWGNHKKNQKALDYAQQQVDRQQNVSEEGLQGKFFTSKDPIVKIVRKVAFPFANFAINQKARLQSDIINLASKNTSKEDRLSAVRSLTGLTVEMAAFYSVSIAIRAIIWELSKKMIGYEESDEEKKKRMANQVKGARTSMVKDFFSPLPIFDAPLMVGFNKIIKAVQDDDSDFELYKDYDSGLWDDWGALGIAIQKVDEMFDKSELAITGKYEDRWGNVKEITEEGKDDMKISSLLSILYNVGIAPSEFGTTSNNIEKMVKKGAGKKKEKKKKEKKFTGF